MKKIAIMRCLRSNSNCVGAACLSAFYRRRGSFKAYEGEEVELAAFGYCSGCGDLILEPVEGMEEKVERILKIHPDAVHMGICCSTRSIQGKPCRVMVSLARRFENHGIKVAWGTHGV